VCVFTRNRLDCQACSLVREQVKPFVLARVPAVLAAVDGARRWVRTRQVRRA
jgi:hypothetical protein